MRALLPLVLLVLAACRPNPGVPDYSGMASLFGDGGVNMSLAGPDPYVPGSRRLVFGAFYEGGSSVELPLDHYFIFSNSYTTVPSDDRVEGLQSDELDFNGTAFWGGGLFWDKPTDMRGWTTLHVSLKSDATNLAVIALRTLYLGPAPASTEITVAVKANDYGYVNDGQWHTLAVPLADFVKQGLDLSRMRSPFTLGNDVSSATAKTGDVLLLDDVYVD